MTSTEFQSSFTNDSFAVVWSRVAILPIDALTHISGSRCFLMVGDATPLNTVSQFLNDT